MKKKLSVKDKKSRLKFLRKASFIFLLFSFLLFSGIILYKSFLRVRNYISISIDKEKETHLNETCLELKEAEKIVKEFEYKFKELGIGQNNFQESDRKEIFLKLIELEKRATNLQVNFFDYKNDLSLMLFDNKIETNSDRLHYEIKNLKIYIDSVERSIENISIEYYLTKDELYLFELSLNEFKEKLKSIRNNANSCY